jgi:hypothetical protein
MAEMLLINPRRRRKARRANPVRKARRTTARRRRSNPIAVAAAPRRSRRRNPIARARRRVMSRRRRIPISLGGGASMMNLVKDALIGGAGAVAFDAAFGQINKYLPASVQTTPGVVGVGDGVKAIITVLLGKALAKPTKGLSVKAAQASLVVQAHGIIKSFVPSSVPLAYYSPARVAQGTNRVGPLRQGVNAYTRPNGGSPLLSAYMPANVTPLLNGARQRENVTNIR